jgi:hypothetical protein
VISRDLFFRTGAMAEAAFFSALRTQRRNPRRTTKVAEEAPPKMSKAAGHNGLDSVKKHEKSKAFSTANDNATSAQEALHRCTAAPRGHPDAFRKISHHPVCPLSPKRRALSRKCTKIGP